jgi:hypothetical protein
MRKILRVVSITSAAVLTAGIAWAATSPLTFSAMITDGVLSISTASLIKGWFSTRNTLDRTKTNLATTWSIGATECSDGGASGSINSTTDGSFEAILNENDSNPIAYTWSVLKDLSAYQNHWYNHTHCDGTVEVHGCAASSPVTVSMTAIGNNGACRTYVDDAGQTVCASDSHQLSLAAVQDADVVDTDCGGDSCGIGQCVQACEHTCDDTYPGRDQRDERQDCKMECPCVCKLQLPSSCPPHDECR